MAVNPNPARISDQMWRFWERFKKLEPTVQLGGIYASKPGYHNYRDALPASDYSVGQYVLDRQGPGWAAAAIDLTFPDAQAADYDTIMLYSDRLLRSGVDPADPRGDFLREFYGQADQDTAVEGWDYQAAGPRSSDASHLWHIHLSFMRAYLEDERAFDAVLSILAGETVDQWRGGDMAGYDRNTAWLLQNGVIDLQDPATIPVDDTAGSDVQGTVPNKLAQTLAEILAAVQGIGAPTQEQVNAAVKAALLDPQVQEALAAAAFRGAQQAERE